MLQVEQLGFQSIQQVAERCNTGCYPDRHRSVFEQYIKTSNLSDGEYLFCAANASVRPLSSDALRKICVLWARKANIDAGPLTPHSVRKTTDDYADLMRKISERMGHHSANMSLAYAVGLPTNSSTDD